MASSLPVKRTSDALPPILAGRETPAVKKGVEEFFSSVEQIFESWVRRAEVERPRASADRWLT